jgi:hypothetical protein
MCIGEGGKWMDNRTHHTRYPSLCGFVLYSSKLIRSVKNMDTYMHRIVHQAVMAATSHEADLMGRHEYILDLS